MWIRQKRPPALGVTDLGRSNHTSTALGVPSGGVCRPASVRSVSGNVGCRRLSPTARSAAPRGSRRKAPPRSPPQKHPRGRRSRVRAPSGPCPPDRRCQRRGGRRRSVPRLKQSPCPLGSGVITRGHRQDFPAAGGQPGGRMRSLCALLQPPLPRMPPGELHPPADHFGGMQPADRPGRLAVWPRSYPRKMPRPCADHHATRGPPRWQHASIDHEGDVRVVVRVVGIFPGGAGRSPAAAEPNSRSIPGLCNASPGAQRGGHPGSVRWARRKGCAHESAARPSKLARLRSSPSYASPSTSWVTRRAAVAAISTAGVS